MFCCDLVVTTGKAVPPLAVFAIVPSVLPRELRYRISSLSASVAATTFPTRILLVVTPRPMGSPLSKSEPGEPGTTFSSPGTSGPIYAESSTPTRTKPTASFDNVPTLARPVPTRAAIRGACTLAFELGCQGCSTATTEFARAHSSLGPSAAVTRGNVTMIPHSLKHYSCRYIRVAYCIRVRDNKETTLAT